MGVSTDAYLAYGYDLGEDPPSFLESWYDFDDFVENLAGVPQWESDEAWGSASKEERSRVYKLGQDAIVACPAQMVTHCSDDYPMGFLAMRGSVLRASRGNPESTDPDSLLLIEATGGVEEFEKWAKENGFVEGEDEYPKWMLFSYWG